MDMGEQQRKVNAWRLSVLAVLLVLAFLVSGVGFCVVNWEKNHIPAMRLNASGNDIVRYWGTEAGEVDSRKGISSGEFSDEDEENKICRIGNVGELAYMRYAISNNVKDYTGYTFELSDNIDLSTDSATIKEPVRDEYGEIVMEDGKPLERYVTVNPYWVPIEIGLLGKNKNITFNGNGYKISGLHIKYDNLNSAKNIGFFASIVGGVFCNVTFENPVIECIYNGESFREDDPERPERPSEICIGVIAGMVDSTYIYDVNIVNPQISLITDNYNAHNFCVGGAVGQLAFTRKNETESINTTSPKKWGLDNVKICKDEFGQANITMSINKGSSANTTYGKATYGYFGGLVGVNISSKVINSVVQDAILTPSIGDDVDGTYYVGGIAGLTTQVAAGRDLIVAAGLYNNLVLNVDLNTISNNEKRYLGNLVGRIYSGSWVYNNVVIGVVHGYDNNGFLWEDVVNFDVCYNKDDVDCVGCRLNGADEYYFLGRDYIGNCVPDGDHTHCAIHQRYLTLSENVRFDEVVDGNTVSKYYTFGTGANAGIDMAQYNHYFASLSDYNADSFTTDEIYYRSQDNAIFTASDLMSLVDNFYTINNEGERQDYRRGDLFYAALPILKYEIGLTVNKVNSVTNEELSYEDKMFEAVYQFRRWLPGPRLGDVFGKKYTITFKANGYTNEKYPDDYPDESLRGKLVEPISLASFSNDANKMEVFYNYQQYIYNPNTEPTCDGYKFLGWKIENYEDVDPNSSSFPSNLRQYVDIHGYYVFGLERVTEPRTLVAIWQLGEFYVCYYQRDPEGNEVDELLNPQEEVVNGELVRYSYKIVYNRLIDRPTDPISDKGFSFEGWYTKLPSDGIVNSDVYRWNDGQKMPGKNLNLYSGWKNNSEKLYDLLNNEVYKKYYKNYDNYFDDASGEKYRQKFNDADYAYKHPAEKKSEYGTLIKELEDAFSRLIVNPAKLKEKLDAFDETKIENLCPFLYETDKYLNYVECKKSVEKYSNTDPYLGLLLDVTVDIDEATHIRLEREIKTYIEYYEKLNEKFDNLKTSLKTTVTDQNGELLNEVDVMIEKYLSLKSDYETSVNNGEYDKYDMSAVENAKRIVEQYWEFDVEDRKDNVPLSEINAAVADYENAWNNKKLKTASTDGNGGKSDGNGTNETKKTPAGFSPIVLSVVIVSVLAVLTFGYIGIDLGVNKRRLALKKADNAKKGIVEESAQKDDDDTYI